MAAEGNSDLSVPDIRTMEELCQPSMNGWGSPIALITIQATNFGLENDMNKKVKNSCQFHGLPCDDANKHLDKFLHVTQSIKVSGVTDDALRLYLFPHPLTHHATAWFDHLPSNSINTFEQMAKMFLDNYFLPSMVTKLRNEITNFRQRPEESLYTFYNDLTLRHRDTINAAAGGTFMKRRTEECYDLIENMTASLTIGTLQPNRVSHPVTSSFDTKIAALKAEMAEVNKNLMRVLQVNQQVKAVTLNCETSCGPHSFSDYPATVGNTQNVYAAVAYQGNTIINPKEDLKGITTQSGTAYSGPMIPTSSSPPVVKRETEATKDMMHPTNNKSTKDIQHLVFPTESLILNSEPVTSPIIEPVASPVSAQRPNQRPSIPYPFGLHDQKLRELTLHVGKEVITFNLDQTSRYSANYIDITANRIDVIDMACEESSQEVLGISDVILFLLEEVDAFLSLEDDPTSLEVDQSYLNSEGDILLLEAFLNDDPSLPSLNQGNYLLEVRKKLKICEAKSDKSSIDEPLEGGFTVVENKENELILTRLVTGWRVCIEYHKLNEATRKDHFTLPFMDQMLERLAGNQYYCFLDGFSSYFQFLIDLKDQEKTTFTCPYRTFAYRRMPFGLCNASGTFQWCMMAIFHDMIEKAMEVFIDDFLVFENSFQRCLSHLEKMLKRTVGENHASWSDKLDDAPWAIRTAYKTPIGCTPYKLVYGKACHLPIELEYKAYWALKHANFDLQTAGDHRKVQLNELRDQAYENSVIYKEKTKRLHDSKIKDRVFNIADIVLLFNSRLNIFSGKLKSCWSGLFTISHVFPYGTIELS
uniref:Reverse transcriptase domain-containing protein n=1 Tax=Tanacetum cinerariifolium TaxID=118510 RepID=A0A699HXW3_TANCI|nr:reverse transcriptase domain-containing protein [Tanacetum cinerariifolium]